MRASAVSALAQFAIRVPRLGVSIIKLLQRCLQDDDDEVRDRAVLYLKIVESAPEIRKTAFLDTLPMNAISLQKSLEQYKLRPAEGPVSFESLPFVQVEVEKPKPAAYEEDHHAVEASIDSAPASSTPEDMAKELYQVIYAC